MTSGRNQVLSGPGWTPVPNYLLDTMSDRDPVQFKILLFLARRLYGYESPRDDFSIRFISDKTGLPRSTVHRHLTMMIHAGIVVVCGKGRRGARRLGISEKRPICMDNIRPSNQATVMRVVPPAERIASRNSGQIKEKQVQENFYNPDSDKGIVPRDFLESLEKSLSAISFNRIRSSLISVSSNRISLSSDIPESLRFMLERSTGMRVVTISDAS